MKKNILSIGAMCAMMFAMQHSVYAQVPTQTTTTTSSVSSAAAAPVATLEKHPMSVKNRLARQQARINQGIKSGELTRSEAKNLERHDANIAVDAKIDKANNGGKLTAAERKNLETRLNKQSKHIYNKKHNERER